ncbi:hypothetical protein RKE29_01690 [Streptomyces sp. B1866]|uniref:hypothetical protein n=1 Tax=Streptomyces sp. B1866 TaxID=3075431 RepID=UPI00288F90AB|nr:hypothetical protein [Streptomyces sp. B1866]MDT3395373.1 hypothetical protein [Streptomyces sp. B1866]
MARAEVAVRVRAARPIAVAASLFPRCATRERAPGGEAADATAALLHRICRGYAVVGVAVPAFGVATGAQLGVLTDAWLVASVALTAAAAGVLALAILPRQRLLLAGDGQPGRAAARLSMLTGVFNLLWAVVVVLMIVRPGSTTGA